MNNTARFSALSHRDFRLFLIGQIISLSGTWMQSVAQGWLVYSLTRSPLYLGIVAASGSLPIMLFTLAGGVIADRFSKRNLLLLTQGLSILPALLLGVLTSQHVITVWQVALFAALLGTINAIDIPVRQSFLIEMVGRSDVANAIALNSAVFNGARIIGPVIAGISIARLGMAACFYINAASFVAVLAALAMMDARGEARPSSEGVLKSFEKGIGFIRGKREVLDVVILIAVFSIIGLPYISLLPVFAAEVLHRGPDGLGFLVGSSGIGALTAALAIAAKGDIRHKTRFMAASALFFSAGITAFSFSNVFALSAFLLGVASWGMVSYLAAANSYIQLLVPDDLRGRVMSVYSFVFLGLVPIGNAVIGVSAEMLGAARSVAAAGCLCLTASLIFAFRHFRERE